MGGWFFSESGYYVGYFIRNNSVVYGYVEISAFWITSQRLCIK